MSTPYWSSPMAKLMNCVGVAALRAVSAAPQLAGGDGLAAGLGEAIV